MNKQFRYEKINNSNTSIVVDLHNGYSVIALSGYNMETESYTTTLLLKDNHVDRWMEINCEETWEFYDATSKSIALVVTNHISDYCNIGFFDKYIEQYEYELRCFDVGNAQLESERCNV